MQRNYFNGGHIILLINALKFKLKKIGFKFSADFRVTSSVMGNIPSVNIYIYMNSNSRVWEKIISTKQMQLFLDYLQLRSKISKFSFFYFEFKKIFYDFYFITKSRILHLFILIIH